MSDYGLFESIQGSEGERKIASRETQRKLDAAIDDVKRQYGSFLYASRDGEEWNDRVALCKNDMIKTVDAHLMPVTGVMRRIVKACKDEWKQKRADKTGPELKPEGDWEGYLKSVDKNSDDAVENCFKEGARYHFRDDQGLPPQGAYEDYESYRSGIVNPEWLDSPEGQFYLNKMGYRYADNGIGAAPDGPVAGTGQEPSDPVTQASAVPVGVPGIQASRFYAERKWDGSGFTDTEPDSLEVGPAGPPTTPFKDHAGGGGGPDMQWDGSGFTPKPGSPAAAPKIFDDGPGGMNERTPEQRAIDRTAPGNNFGTGTAGPAASVAPAAPAAAAAAAPAVAAPSGGGGGTNSGSGSGGGDSAPGGAATPRPMTSGDVSDGGVAGAENGNNSAITGKDYVVQEGDTLTDIAQRGYGDMNKYDDLAKANGITNPDVITPGQTIKSLDGAEFGGNGGISGDKTNPAGGGSDNNIATPDAGPAAATPAAPAPAAPLAAEAPAAKVGSLALAQYMDWCDSFGVRRASFDSLDKYAANLNDRAYFEIASALTDPSSPIYRVAGTYEDDYGDFGPVRMTPEELMLMQGFGGPGKGVGELEGGQKINPDKFKRGSQRRTAAPDYLQKADEALTNLLNQKAEEFQETIAPLQQALQTVQQAEALQQAQNPLGVQPPAGTVNVLPQQAGGDPNGAAGGGDPSMGGMDPAMMQQMMGGGGDPSQMQMQARRKRQGKANGKVKRSDGPYHSIVQWDDGTESREISGDLWTHGGGRVWKDDGPSNYGPDHPARSEWHNQDPKWHKEKRQARRRQAKGEEYPPAEWAANPRPGYPMETALDGGPKDRSRAAVEKRVRELSDYDLPDDQDYADYDSWHPPKKARGAKAPHHAGIVNDVDEWGKQRGVTTGNPEVDMAQFQSETGKPIGPKQRNKLTKPVSTANPMPKSKSPITTKMPKKASFFTRKVAGWEWDDHLNGYIANKPNAFTCKCGSKHPVPSYSTCKCGKIWNSYVIGTGGDSHHASVEKFICREIPVREGVIVANKRRRQRRAMTDLGLNVDSSAPHPDKPIMLVYGGAFNPPHQGHVGALQDAHDTLSGAGYNVEGTIVAPTADKLLAKKQMPLEHRLNLQSRANIAKSAFPQEINGSPVMVHTGPSEEVEQAMGKPRRTDLAQWAQRYYPNHTIVNVTGEDAAVPGAPDIHPSLYSGAPGSNHEGFAYLTMPRDSDESMSSSKIRAALAAGQPLPGMTPQSEGVYRQELARLRNQLTAAKRRSEIIKYTEDEEEEPSYGKNAGKVKRHNLSDPGPLGDGKDDKMPDISDDLGKDWYKRGPGGKYARRNRRSR